METDIAEMETDELASHEQASMILSYLTIMKQKMRIEIYNLCPLHNCYLRAPADSLKKINLDNGLPFKFISLKGVNANVNWFIVQVLANKREMDEHQDVAASYIGRHFLI